MDDRDFTQHDETNCDDHWGTWADATDLTIEGQRLIAEEIGYELKLLWSNAVSWLRDLTGTPSRGSSPPV